MYITLLWLLTHLLPPLVRRCALGCDEKREGEMSGSVGDTMLPGRDISGCDCIKRRDGDKSVLYGRGGDERVRGGDHAAGE